MFVTTDGMPRVKLNNTSICLCERFATSRQM